MLGSNQSRLGSNQSRSVTGRPITDDEYIGDAELVFEFDEYDFEAAWAKAIVVQRIGRGIGFCDNQHCSLFLKGIFIYHHEGPFCCVECKKVGIIEAERGKIAGPSGTLVGIVEIEYCFDTASRRYREKLILRDDSLGLKVRTYTAFCPLLNNERRASKLAEVLMANLNEMTGPLAGDLPFVPEKTISFDIPIERLRGQLLELEARLKHHPFYAQEEVVSQSSVSSKT